MKSDLVDFQNRHTAKYAEKDEAFYRKQLRAVCDEVREDESNFIIKCCFHHDNNPSLRVHRFEGFFHCFACRAGGSWNKLAAKLSMEKVGAEESADDNDDRRVRDALKRLGLTVDYRAMRRADTESAIARPLFMDFTLPEWRGMSGDFLRARGVVMVNDLYRAQRRVGIPIRDIDGQIHGYTCRIYEPEDARPKYTTISADREWARAKEADLSGLLWGLDDVLDAGTDRCVVVEAPVSALWLWYHGIPAVALMGVAQWSTAKASLLAGAGIRHVVLALDSDSAGQSAADQVAADLTSYMATLIVLAMPAPKVEGKKVDPGDLKGKQIDFVRKRLESLGAK